LIGMPLPSHSPRTTATLLYGPVSSRRFGVSLGLNLSGPGKQCSFNCRYCFRGFNDAPAPGGGPEQALPDARTVLATLDAWLAAGGQADVVDWTLAGNGEPTDHPEFPEIIAGLVRLRDRRAPGVKISVLTNGMGLVPRRNPRAAAVRAALGLTDRPCLKLDAGRPDSWQRLAQPADGVTLDEWLAAAIIVRPLILQTLFVQGAIDTTTPDELAALQAVYARLQPETVYLLTLDKPPADADILPVPRERMAAIGRQFTADATPGSPRFLLF
jgi:wyosine [tRNA(Phe)-imidazoG37] synthetase (radical SAM superfamily)